MKVSIVTISYNQARFLEQAICSVLEQDYPNIEYIVVDAGSTDGSRNLIEKYKGKIDRIIFERDRGAADGLNKGFQAASGELFGYINSDDCLLPGAVSKIVNIFKKNKRIDVINAHGFVIDEHDSILYREFSWPFSLKSYMAGCGTVMQQSTYFRADSFRKTQGFNIKNTTCWDGELMVDMALNGASFALFNEFISCFRIYSDSISGSARLQQDYLENINNIISKINISSLVRWQKIYCILNRLKNPYGLFWRILDEFVHFNTRRSIRRLKI